MLTESGLQVQVCDRGMQRIAEADQLRRSLAEFKLEHNERQARHQELMHSVRSQMQAEMLGKMQQIWAHTNKEKANIQKVQEAWCLGLCALPSHRALACQAIVL